MIYNYCCTGCGASFSGEKIAFDLVELLDFDLPVVENIAKDGHVYKKSNHVGPALVRKEDGKDRQKPALITNSNSVPDFIRKQDVEKEENPLSTQNKSEKDDPFEKKEIKTTVSKNTEKETIIPEEKSRLTYKAIHAFVSSDELMEIAKAAGVQLQDGKRVKIAISLRQFFSHMTVGREEKGKYVDLLKDDDTILTTLVSALIMGEQKENVQMIASKYLDEINVKFKMKQSVKKILPTLKNEKDSKSASEIENNPEHYEASFEIIPEFFDNKKNIYSVRYITGEGKKNEIRNDIGSFRGYCTDSRCRKPILKHAGKYPHRVVGMLGAMSAGKTSMIAAMTVELESEYKSLGVEYISGIKKLSDDGSKDREIDYHLYKHGWAVRKTPGGEKEGRYNASFLLTNTSGWRKSVILTLADIAGEECYNEEYKGFDKDAFNHFPIIGHCDAYLICACINQKGYGNADGKKVLMEPSAVTDIADGIYSRYYDEGKERIPPLCIVMTKADMAKENTAAGGDDNPFNSIVPARKEVYLFNEALIGLKSIYATTKDENIRESMQICADAYFEMSKKTYVGIISASAMGREAKNYPGIINTTKDIKETSKEPVLRKRVEKIWEWILKVCGVVPVHGNYIFPEVPSYLDYYSKDQSHVYNIDNCQDRIKAVWHIGINQAESDRAIYRASMEEVKWWENCMYHGDENARKIHVSRVMPKSLSESEALNIKKLAQN